MGRTTTAFAAVALGIALSAVPAQAQTIGFKLGASLSNFSADEGDWDRKTGFVGGGFIRFGMGAFNLQPEILSVSKGAELSEGGETASISLEYIEIPVMLQVPLSLGGLSPYIVGGPAIAFEIGCSFDTPQGDSDCDEDGDDGSRKKTDFGVTAGAGLEFPLGPGALSFEGRYTWGLTNLNDDANDSFEIKNRAAYLTAGYTIWLGRRY